MLVKVFLELYQGFRALSECYPGCVQGREQLKEAKH